MITPIDTRARWIADMAERYEQAAKAWCATFKSKGFPQGTLALGALFDLSAQKMQRWLDASPDLRAAFVAKGWQP